MIIQEIFKNSTLVEISMLIFCIQTAVVMIIVGLSLVFRSTHYHEVGHTIAIRLFDRVSRIIIAERSIRNLLRVQFKKETKLGKPRILKFGTSLLRRTLDIEYITKDIITRKALAEVVVERNFIQFNKKQLKIISIAGYITQVVYLCVITVMVNILFGNTVLAIGLIVLFITIYAVEFKKSMESKSWSDGRIFKYTEEFMEEIKMGLIREESSYCYHKTCATKIIARQLLNKPIKPVNI